MKLINVIKLDDCFDGSVIFKYCFDAAIDEAMMRKLAENGKLQYFPEFLKPFFKIITCDGVQLKGIIRDYDFEVLFPFTNKQKKKENFDTLLSQLVQNVMN
ncbi:MAG: hypothetical protein QG657_3228 [Acidobacteriota bacterium]|nr:hypothetical protein [Acidobacteriota bacterium]